MPLKDTASLGETSRLNLAFKIIFNALNPVGTMVFDEIDTGISGAVGVAVAKKLHEIGLSSQCLVITHLPQVAAISDYQYWVSKKVINNTTKTEIKIMSNDNFTKALATMISGTEVTENSMNAAKDLINTLKAE
jgi:DNA repair protein RecN (Recombination protein N)